MNILIKKGTKPNWRKLLNTSERHRSGLKQKQRIRWYNIIGMLISLKSIKCNAIPIRVSALFWYGNGQMGSKVHIENQIITSSDKIPLKSSVGTGVNQISYYNQLK